jgi:xanthine/CO dehydrogenase XdhC/CoxF family maturation factor
VTADELRTVCGAEIVTLVEALTEDPAITKYRPRKAALRARIIAAGPDAARVSLADKLAKQGLSLPPRKRKLRHYRATLHPEGSHYGPTDLIRQLTAELDRFA